jgi:NAD(P)-dependent dehydrogenase (short-subunit alcohol dehydrogenase family)
MAQRTWLITGVSSGFGRHLAEQLLERGDRVVGTVRDPGKVAELVDRYPEAFRAEVLDMTATAAIHALVDRAFASLGRIDVIISNAGYGLFGAAEELTDAQVEHIVATNLVGRSTSSARPCPTSVPRVAGASSRSPRTAGRWPTPATRCTTPPSGGSRASSSQSPRRSRTNGTRRPVDTGVLPAVEIGRWLASDPWP